jgi:hypothetical protein
VAEKCWTNWPPLRVLASASVVKQESPSDAQAASGRGGRGQEAGRGDRDDEGSQRQVRAESVQRRAESQGHGKLRYHLAPE